MRGCMFVSRGIRSLGLLNGRLTSGMRGRRGTGLAWGVGCAWGCSWYSGFSSSFVFFASGCSPRLCASLCRLWQRRGRLRLLRLKPWSPCRISESQLKERNSMKKADQQMQIRLANKAAFEDLALRWRNSMTGETEPDLREALLNMVCDYFTSAWVHGNLRQVLSDLMDGIGDWRMPLQLTAENQISDEARAALKRIKPDDAGRDPNWTWAWDEGELD
jgi:hypothetical protein